MTTFAEPPADLNCQTLSIASPSKCGVNFEFGLFRRVVTQEGKAARVRARWAIEQRGIALGSSRAPDIVLCRGRLGQAARQEYGKRNTDREI
jgi:hypothetical protein